MESERCVERDVLHDANKLRERVVAMPRGHAKLNLAYTVFLAAYIGILVYTGSIEGGSSILGGVAMALVLPPVIASLGLIAGANERFQARQRATARQWLAIGVFLAALGILLVWSIARAGYPWWVSLIYGMITVVFLGFRPLLVLLRTRRSPIHGEPHSGVKHGLSRDVRIVTVLIGLWFGLLCALASFPSVLLPVMAFGMMLTVIALTAQTTSWGLHRVGFEWRLAQWMSVGFGGLVMFALVVWDTASQWVVPIVAALAGLTAATPILVSAFHRGRSYGASTA